MRDREDLLLRLTSLTVVVAPRLDFVDELVEVGQRVEEERIERAEGRL